MTAIRKKRKPAVRKSKGFLGSITDKFNKAEMLSAVKNGGLIAIGLLGGRELSRKFFPDDSEGFKRYLGEIIQLGGGVLLASQKNPALKYIGYGLTASGMVGVVGKVMNKDLMTTGIMGALEGFSVDDIINGTVKGLPVYNEEDIKQLKLPAMDGAYKPDLPEIEDIKGTDEVIEGAFEEAEVVSSQIL
jgi:hypothetical protein